jgi:hypothetical protein
MATFCWSKPRDTYTFFKLISVRARYIYEFDAFAVKSFESGQIIDVVIQQEINGAKICVTSIRAGVTIRPGAMQQVPSYHVLLHHPT